jgi:hypothetical protein
MSNDNKISIKSSNIDDIIIDDKIIDDKIIDDKIIDDKIIDDKIIDDKIIDDKIIDDKIIDYNIINYLKKGKKSKHNLNDIIDLDDNITKLNLIENENEDIIVKKYRIVDADNTKFDCYFYEPWFILVIIKTDEDGEIELYGVFNVDNPSNKFEIENGNIYEVPLNDLLISKSWLTKCKIGGLHNNSEALIQDIINEFKSKPNVFLTLSDIVSNTFDKSYNLLLKEKYNESIEGFNQCIIIAKEINQQYTIEISYYNIACCYALMKDNTKNELVFEYLYKCIDEGYHNFDHAIKDVDLDYIKNNHKFSDVINKMVQKCSNDLFQKYSLSYETSLFLNSKNIVKNFDSDLNEVEI